MKPLALLTTLLLAASTVHAAPVVIAGIARDGSHEKAPLANAPVQLLVLRDGDKRVPIDETRTDANGRFTFKARELNDKDLLFANISHGNFDYWNVAYDGGNRLKQVGINVDPGKVEMLVFDTTTQPGRAPLDFQVHHLAIKSTPTGVHVIERIVVENPSKVTYLGFGQRRISVLLNLPSGAKNINLDSKSKDKESQLVQTKDGWGIVKPIMPNAYGEPRMFNAIIVSYDVPWPSRLPWAKTVDLSREIAYPTRFFFVARETGDKELKVDAPALGPETKQSFQGNGGATQTRLVNMVGAPMAPAGAPDAMPVKPGQTMDVKISRPVSNLFWGFAGLVGAMCLFLPVALLKPKRAERSHGQSVSSHTSARGSENGDFVPLNGFAVAPTLTSSSRDLVQRIADLDDAFEAKQIDEATYQAQRAAWKKQLIDSLASSPDEH